MNGKYRNDAALDRVEEGRREFIKKLVAGTALSAPLLASFSMDGGLIEKAVADSALCASRTNSYGAHTFRARYSDDTIQADASATITLDCKTLVVALSAPMVGSQAEISAFLVDKENDLNSALETGTNIFTNANPIWNAMDSGEVFLGLTIIGSGYSDYQEARFTPVAS